MSDEIIPEDVQKFILENIDSIAQMEGLLLLRANPDRKWSAEDVARRIYIKKSEAEIFMNRLSARQLILTSGGQNPLYEYKPHPELENMVQRMADAYSRYLLPVTHLIHSKEKFKIQNFADAFKIKKE
jgi:hypothetical protein